MKADLSKEKLHYKALMLPTETCGYTSDEVLQLLR